MASPPFSFGLDTSLINKTFDTVRSELDAMNQRADAALNTANGVITQLANFEPMTADIPAPEAPEIPDGYLVEAPQFNAISTSGLAPNVGPLPNYAISPIEVAEGSIEDIGDFTPSIGAIQMPNRPSPIDVSDAPMAPQLEQIAIPDTPTLELPQAPDLLPVQSPEFQFPTLPEFDAEAPEFEGEAPTVSALAQWSETPYQPDVLPDVIATVRKMLDGETGLPEAIENALYERAVDRENKTANQEVQQAVDAWAGRGFEMPPGMLVEQVNAARDQAAQRTNAANREIAVEVARINIENLRQAVAQGIACEQQLFSYFDAAVQRAFDMARARVDAEIASYNAQVQLFNARQSAYQSQVEVFRAKLEAALSELQVQQNQLEAERLKSQINESSVRIYNARIEGLRARVDVFNAQLQGAEVQARVQSNQIEGYRASVEAYRQRVEARKVEFDAYESEVRAEASKGDILRAEADAFASTVRAQESKNNVRIENIRARIESLNAAVNEYRAKVEYERQSVSAQTDTARSRIEAFTAQVNQEAERIRLGRQNSEANVRAIDSKTRAEIARFEILSRQYDARIQEILQQATIQTTATQAAGQMASQLAAGAMSAISVSAAMRGGSSSSLSNSASKSINYQSEF